MPPPQSYSLVRETWLSQKISAGSALEAALLTFFMVVVSVIFWQNLAQAQQWMSASSEAVFQKKEIWRAWTTLFVHADGKHLLSNSFLFFILGSFLINYFGWFVFPLIAVFSGGIINLWVLSQMPTYAHLIGMSGVVFWMGGFWLVLYFLLDRRKTFFQRSLRALGVALALFFPSQAFDPQISYQSHFWGFILGCLLGGVYFLVMKNKFRAAEVTEQIIEEDPLYSAGSVGETPRP